MEGEKNGGSERGREGGRDGGSSISREICMPIEMVLMRSNTTVYVAARLHH